MAAANISLGEALTPNHIKLAPWPKATIPLGAVRSLKDAEGRLARTAMFAGELLDSKLAPAGQGGLMPVLVPIGKRAVSIIVDQAIQKSGFVVPNSRVDVLVTMAGTGWSSKEPDRPARCHGIGRRPDGGDERQQARDHDDGDHGAFSRGSRALALAQKRERLRWPFETSRIPPRFHAGCHRGPTDGRSRARSVPGKEVLDRDAFGGQTVPWTGTGFRGTRQAGADGPSPVSAPRPQPIRYRSFGGPLNGTNVRARF